MTWLGMGLAACGTTADVNPEPAREAMKAERLQQALAPFRDVRVVGETQGVAHAVTGQLGSLGEDPLGALARLSPLFGLEDGEWVLQRTRVDAQGHRHLRFQQLLHGLRVVGGELLLHADAQGNLYAANGHVRPGEPAPAVVTLAPEAARVAAERGSDARGAVARAEPQQVYLLAGSDAEPRLAYEVRVTGEREGMPAEDIVYVDARRGGILLVNPRIHPALRRELHTANNRTTLPGPLLRSEGQAPVGDTHADTNYDMLGVTYRCYQTLFQRDSYNNAGASLLSTVHYGRDYVNAYWDGTQMVYGDGDGVNSAPLGLDLDVTVHELTHAVTDTESDLIYAGESGGLNESMSDIFAGVCESWQRGWATDADVFKIGEDIWTPGTPGDALRYMDDPARDGLSLDFYGDFSPSTDVHYSSGISNLVFSLLAKGGTHPRGKTSQAVSAIGPEKAGRIFYKANTELFTASTTFEQARTYTVMAAESLYGVGSAEASAVESAWLAVGVPLPPPSIRALVNGVGVSVAGAGGLKTYFSLQVPAGQPGLSFDLRGGTGDADLYVKRGSVPTTSSYDCRPYLAGNTEKCSFASPAAGTWYVMVHGFTAYSGATLKGMYGTGSAGTPVSTTAGGVLVLNQQLQHGPYNVVAGTSFKVVMSGLGDPDLYVRFGQAPTTYAYDCRPFLSGPQETCEVTVPTGQGTAYVMVQGYAAASYTLAIDYTRP